MVITHLRMGSTVLNEILYRIGKHSNTVYMCGLCTHYNKVKTVKPVLDCKRFSNERRELITVLEDGKHDITLGNVFEKLS